MAEVDWGNEANEAPKKKSRVPKWAWFCGGGCLLAIVAAGVVAVLAFNFAKDAADPETQWARLAEVVPYETRPEGNIVGFKIPFQDIQFFTLPQENGVSGAFLIAAGPEGEDFRAQYFDGEKKIDLGPIAGNMGRFNVEEGVLNLQGRELRTLRFTSHERSEGDDKELSPMHKSTLAVDLTKDGSDTAVIFQYDVTKSLAPVDEKAVVEFLAPFKLGEIR